ncbi:MAG: hypothetical protein ACFBSD_00685 [Paracoccaceae bacterium]
MLQHISAHCLLERPHVLDIERLAERLTIVMPEIGRVEYLRGPKPGAGLLTIDGGLIVVMNEPGPLSDALTMADPDRILTWDPGPAIGRHCARIVVACGGDTIPGLDGARTYAATVTLVSAALTAIAPVCALYWPAGGVFSPPDALSSAARGLLAGRLPLDLWVGLTSIEAHLDAEEHPGPFGPPPAEGAATTGLLPFLGREIELAPAFVDQQTALDQIRAVACAALSGDLKLEDGVAIPDGPAGGTLVRLRRAWHREGVPAAVLVPPDSVVNARSLRLISPGRRSQPGLFRRLPVEPHSDAGAETGLDVAGLSVDGDGLDPRGRA